jgi:HD-GYP domain-containing protein (c-di-GMP phosphodiesterase class II)
MQRQIRPEQVKLGMYVGGFGGAWVDHPFWRAKFLLKNPRDVERVRESGVPYVIIDDERGIGPDQPPEAATPATPVKASNPPALGAARRPAATTATLDYEKARQKSDRQRAVALVSRALKVLRRAFDDARLGRAVRMAEVTTVVDEVVESVERGPRTLLEVLRTKTRDEYTYLHSVAVCTLMVNVARQLGKGDGETRDYGLAGLLHDLGKMGISELILNKAGALTEAEFAAVRTHPEHGYQLLCETPDIPEMALDVCRHHHEKMDGTGYPFGLPAEAISLVARVGAVCDVYDALTSDRVYKEAWSPGEAIAAMWSWEGHFDRQLLFTFMQSVGIFPTGMLVQLRSNRLAIVLDPKRRNSGPRVLAFYATRDRAFIEAEEIVIKDNLANDSIVAPAEPEDWGLENWDRVAERLLSGDHRLLAA